MTLKHILVSLLLLIGGCGALSAEQEIGGEELTPSVSAAQMRGSSFARTHCSQCHSIEAGFSPRPEAPSFAAIINTPGLSDQTLTFWLANSHNFPEVMDFEIASEQIDDLAQYMLTLKDEDYRRPIQ
jgi:mono/diheme cytochrome c family protein